MTHVHAAGAAHAAHVKMMQDQEEEEMTSYSAGDPVEYEYKIIRNQLGAFGKPDKLRQILAEEAKAGWEFLEKFDNNRIRLKRRIEWRERDGEITWDPYRTTIGMGDTKLVLVILAVVFGVIAMIGVIVAIAK